MQQARKAESREDGRAGPPLLAQEERDRHVPMERAEATPGMVRSRDALSTRRKACR